MLSEGCTVFITLKCQQRYRDSNFYELRVQNIEYLQTVKDTRIHKLTITMDANAIHETVVNDISTMINESPGHIQLFFQLKDSDSKNIVLLRSTDVTVDIKHKLISYIEGNPAMDYRIN